MDIFRTFQNIVDIFRTFQNVLDLSEHCRACIFLFLSVGQPQWSERSLLEVLLTRASKQVGDMVRPEGSCVYLRAVCGVIITFEQRKITRAFRVLSGQRARILFITLKALIKPTRIQRLL